MNPHLMSLRKAHLAESAGGLLGVCSSHPAVIREAAALAAQKGCPLLVEATANQVNPDGGYTGMTPDIFAAAVREAAREAGLPAGAVLLGADHLGPAAWSTGPVEAAMERAAELVRQCVAAGFSKIHLDTARPCADERGVDGAVAARRAAALCEIAEKSAGSKKTGTFPCYVIGDEVPAPGGGLAEGSRPPITSPDAVAATIRRHENAFSAAGLQEAWQRVVAVVVQPGVEFGDRTAAVYRKPAALSRVHGDLPGPMTFEVHSADYQAPSALAQMVEDHFLLIKVGPCLTFAYREALFDLARIEEEMPDLTVRSRLRQVMEELMVHAPAHWRSHYRGSDDSLRFLRRYSLRDRIRYYWHLPAARRAVQQLMDNLRRPVPAALVHQFLPEIGVDVGKGVVPLDPERIVSRRIRSTLAPIHDAVHSPQKPRRAGNK
jgi:D-tagatose-1,6-bisphosphate aldolase subunit GatZ/KbaZ